MTNQDPVKFFSNRAKNYALYRPNYPHILVQKLAEIMPLGYNFIVADIGSGTGIFTRLLLDTGAIVYGVEPNKKMREEAESALKNYPNFTSIAGRAEGTTLPNHHVNLVTVAQALHWFNLEKASKEFKRILTSNGYIALIWNARRRSGSSFLEKYDKLLMEFCPDYKPLEYMEYSAGKFKDFVDPEALYLFTTFNEQKLDWDGLKGRLLSSSYALKPEEKEFDLFLNKFYEIFAKYQQDNLVIMEYETRMYYGQFSDVISHT